MRSKFKQALALLILIWVLVVITAYFVVQKPWPLEGAGQAVGALLDLILAVLLVALSGGLGRRILGPLPLLHSLEAMALQAGLGLGVFSLVVLAAGVVGLVGRFSAWFGLLLAMVLLWKQALRWLASPNQSIAELKPQGAVAWTAFCMINLLLAISLLEALAPPLKWDSLVYHLALPQEYLESGRIGFVSGNLFVGFPQLAEMHFTWAMGLRAGTTAAVVGWAVGVIAILGLAGMASRLLGSKTTWLAPAILLSGASLWQGLAWAYVDHWVLLYGLVTFISLERFSASHSQRWLWTASAGIGLAASAKYTGGLLGLAAVLWLVLDWLRGSDALVSEDGTSSGHTHRELRDLLFNLTKLTVAAIVVFSPWLVKNWLTTGNPLYPFLLPGREIDALRQTFHAQGEATLDVLSIPILPWLVTVLGVEGGAGFNSSIGPLYLALIPGLFFYSWHPRSRTSVFLRRAGWVGLMVWILWGVAGLLADPLSRSRHYYGFLPVIALLAAAGFQGLEKLKIAKIRIGWVISRLVLFSFVLVSIDALFHAASRNPMPVITGQESKSQYLADQLGWYGPTMDYLEGLPTNSQIEMLWEARSYYCVQECNPDVILDKWWYWRRTFGEGERIAAHLKDQGVSHVLIYDFGAAFERRSRELQQPADWEALEDFRSQQLKLIERFGEGYSLYTWKDL